MAVFICSANDVIANTGVIAAGALVAWTGSNIPDLVIGTVIGVVVLVGGIRILRLPYPSGNSARAELPAPLLIELASGRGLVPSDTPRRYVRLEVVLAALQLIEDVGRGDTVEERRAHQAFTALRVTHPASDIRVVELAAASN